MSDTLSPSHAFAPPLFRPQMMIGAVTPLWGYFTGAAMTGMAMWWMSRWMPAAKPQAVVVVAAPEPVFEPPVETVAAPPMLALAAEPAPEAPPVVVEAALAEIEPAPTVEAAPDVKLLAAPAAPRSRKAKDVEPKPD